MDQFPEFISQSKDLCEILVYPYGAKRAGFSALPFLEIPPRRILERMRADLSISLDYLHPAKLRITSRKSDIINAAGQYSFFPIIQTKSFLSDLEDGDYLEAIYSKKGVVAAILGSDEAWLFLRREIFLEADDIFTELIAESIDNSKLLGSFNRLREFFPARLI